MKKLEEIRDARRNAQKFHRDEIVKLKGQNKLALIDFSYGDFYKRNAGEDAVYSITFSDGNSFAWIFEDMLEKI